MAKLYKKDVLSTMTKTNCNFASFGFQRRGYRHRGQDFQMTKGMNVCSLFDGIINEIIYDDQYHGVRIETRTDLRFLEENNPGIQFWQNNKFIMLEHFGWMQRRTSK